MLKSEFTYSYVDDEFALYVPANEHPSSEHSLDEAEFTHRSDDPVSICRRKVCAGVPIETFAKYRVSCHAKVRLSSAMKANS